MFDIGFFELILVAVVGLVVIGPERLPGTVRTVALWIGRLKRSLRETRQELEEHIGADEIRRQLHNEDVMRSLNATRDEIQKTLSDPLGSLDEKDEDRPQVYDHDGRDYNPDEDDSLKPGAKSE